ncbi:YraN family protein [Candidatus Daviesbacteria bacterium]|nr:YraN family protein [Candidatus Daviesbacteria bacterium]
MSNQERGNYGEDLACDYLKKHGYKILERNYRIRGGEIDIVAKDGDTLVFIEVKTRYSHDFGPPAESMTFWKVKALLKTAKFYVQKINWGDKEYRLDFVGVDFVADIRSPKIELIKNITS